MKLRVILETSEEGGYSLKKMGTATSERSETWLYPLSDDRGFGLGLFDLAQDGYSADVGHFQVRQYGVKLVSICKFKSVVARGRPLHLYRLAAQVGVSKTGSA